MTLTGTPAKIASSMAGSPSSVPGILMNRFGRLALACSALRLGHRPRRVMRQQRRDLERDPAVHPRGPLVDRREHVGGPVRSWIASSKNSASSDLPALDQAPDLRRRTHLLCATAWSKIGRIRGQAGDRQFVDVALQRAAGQQIAGDVVQPEALAQRMQLFRVAFIASSPRHCLHDSRKGRGSRGRRCDSSWMSPCGYCASISGSVA